MDKRNAAQIPRPLRTKGQNNAAQNTRPTPQGHSSETTEGPPPIQLQEAVNKEVNRLIQEGHIVKVQEKK